MKRSPRPFKDTQVYDWSAEPKDERPSEFVPSTGYSTLSGLHGLREAGPYRSRPRGLPLLAICAIVIAAGVAALFGFLHLVRS